jgi:hypothetical protein
MEEKMSNYVWCDPDDGKEGDKLYAVCHRAGCVRYAAPDGGTWKPVFTDWNYQREECDGCPYFYKAVPISRDLDGWMDFHIRIYRNLTVKEQKEQKLDASSRVPVRIVPLRIKIGNLATVRRWRKVEPDWATYDVAAKDIMKRHGVTREEAENALDALI